MCTEEDKIFIYYRHYGHGDNPTTDLNIIIDESLEFCEMYKKKYNENFKLLSFVIYDTIVSNEKITSDVNKLRDNNTKNLEFDYSFKRNDRDKKLNKIHINRWDDIFKKYNIKK